MKQLTKESGTHSVQVIEGGNWFIDNYQSVTHPRSIAHKEIDGKKHIKLLTADDPFEGTNIRKPEMGSIKGLDGSTLYTRMYKPYNFSPNKKYPVLVYVYGGPHAQMVTNTWNGGGPLWMNEFANRGYIVFTLIIEDQQIEGPILNNKSTVSWEPLKWKTRCLEWSTSKHFRLLMRIVWLYTAGAMVGL